MTKFPFRGTTKIESVFQVNSIDEVSAVLTYIGYESMDGYWYIKKITDTAVQHATEKNNTSYTAYDTAWTNRASLTYENFTDAF